MKPNPISHPGTPKAVFAISAAIAISIVLTTSLAQGAYNPLKYLLSFALLYSSGFFLLPRRRVFIQHPERAGNSVDFNRLQKDHDKIDWSGWYECDRITENLVEWIDHKPVPCTDEKVKDLATGNYNNAPLSINIAIIHVLLAVFINPLAGIGMEKSNWIYVDLALAVYLLVCLRVALKEKSSPRCEVIALEHNGDPRNTYGKTARSFDPPSLEHLIARYWPMLITLVVLVSAFTLNASKTLYGSEFVLFDLVKAGGIILFISGIPAYLFSFLTIGWGNGSISYKWSALVAAALFFAIFIACATSKIPKRIVNPPPPSEGDSGYPDEPDHYDY